MGRYNGGTSVYKLLAELPWHTYPLRLSVRSQKTCEVCSRPIYVGQFYRDGGQTRRAHEACATQQPERRP